MSNEVNISGKIREFILDRFPLARQVQLTDEFPLLEGGIVDSLGILELVNFMKDGFGISVSDEELVPENFSTIRGLAAFVEWKTGQELGSCGDHRG